MVQAEPANNAAPVFPDEIPGTADIIDVNRSVDENSPPGANVGKPVVANDASGEVLTYTLTDQNTGGFRIDPATGQITVGPRITLDAVTAASYTVMVVATDPMGANATQEVTITVKNVNEAPMISEGFTRNSQPEYDDGTDDDQVAVAITAAKVVETYEATDPEIIAGDNACVMASCTWSISGTDAGDFKISNADTTFGALTFKKAPNYEMPEDANRDNVYNVTVVATDKGVATDNVFDEKNRMTATRDVAITITNVDEDGDGHPIVGAAQGRNRADRHPGGS